MSRYKNTNNVFSMIDTQTVIKEQLEQVAKGLLQPYECHYPSLFSGEMGEVIFFMYYYQYTGNEYWYDTAIEKLEWIINRIDQLPYRSGFCTGLAGTFWGVEHLIEQDFLDSDTRESLLDFDAYLGKEMVNYMTIGYFDFLHGAMGIAMYLLKRRQFNPEVDTYLNQTIELLYKHAEITDGRYAKWTSKLKETDETSILNIGLSHGMAGIVMLLIRFLKAGVQTDTCGDLLHKSVSLLLTQEQDIQKYYSYFPTSSTNFEEPTRKSRLGWCYGDLGIGLTLLQAAGVAGQSTWADKGMEVMNYATQRRDLIKNSIYDAGLCHGSAGAAHVFQRMFIETGLPQFQDARQYWNEQTMLMAKPAMGVGGFMPFTKNHEAPVEMARNLLEGAAGIGLSLIHADSDILPDWDACLLLS
jgi:lantibiotic modifying enzyme